MVVKRISVTLRHAHGFTLVETIITILIFSVVGLLLMNIVRIGATLYEEVLTKTELKDNLYLAQRRIVQDVLDIRDIKHAIYADKTRFRFVKSNLDTIQYRYYDGKLYRQVNTGSEFQMVQYLTDSTRFCYCTKNDSSITMDPLDASSLLSIWSVRLDLYAERSYHTMNMRTSVFPLNYRYGIVKN